MSYFIIPLTYHFNDYTKKYSKFLISLIVNSTNFNTFIWYKNMQLEIERQKFYN
jgi:hypothetical protein